MNQFPKIVSIVVTYNADKWVDKCFGSLTNSSIPNHIILAIDNKSSDNTVSNIKSKFPQVVLLETGNNLGFGKANNIGLKWALQQNADYVFLLNQDAWVFDDTLQELVDVSSSNTNYGIISPVHLNRDNTLDIGFAYYCLQDIKSEFILDSFNYNRAKNIYPTDFVNAAAWLITKGCLQNNGGFMPIFPHYGEDLNYCERVLQSGLKIGFTPGNTIIHDRDLNKRKVSFKQKFNRMYVNLLGIFTSNKKRGIKEYSKHCIIESLKSLKIYYKTPLILLLTPIALVLILVKSKQIHLQRKQALMNHPNFLAE
jgi:GT2 family glycosyltransferase